MRSSVGSGLAQSTVASFWRWRSKPKRSADRMLLQISTQPALPRMKAVRILSLGLLCSRAILLAEKQGAYGGVTSSHETLRLTRGRANEWGIHRETDSE